MSWINLSALWKIVVVGLICGAGLPALFAVGLRALAIGARPTLVDQEGAHESVGSQPLGVAIAAACFAVVLTGIAWGIYMIVSSS